MSEWKITGMAIIAVLACMGGMLLQFPGEYGRKMAGLILVVSGVYILSYLYRKFS